MDDSKGVHVQATLLRLNGNGNVCAIQMQIWPLSDDPELHKALSEVIRAAVHLELANRRVVGPACVDLTAQGPVQ